VVRQRLALGGLVPEIREAWRAGEVNAETAQAFGFSQGRAPGPQSSALTS
jgi:hypothetical protein